MSLTTPDSRITGRIFKKCRVCKAEKYLPIKQAVCDRCLKEEQLTIPKNTRHINPPEDKPKPKKQAKKKEPIKKGDVRRKFWVV